MKELLLNHCVEAGEARLYDFVNVSKIIVTDSIPTMGVSKGGRFFINKSFYKDNIQHIIGLILHESLHVYFNHVEERYEHPLIANLAMDVVINNQIDKIGYSLPDTKVTYESLDVPRTLKTTKEIYEYLLERADKISQEVYELCEQEHDLDQLDQQQQQGQESEQQKQDQKKIAAVIAHNVEYTLFKRNERLCQIEKRRDFVQSIEKTLGSFLTPEFHRTFARPRRYRPDNLLLPASRSHVLKPSISIYLDVSGSMEGDNIKLAYGVLNELDKVLNHYHVSYFTFNTNTEKVDDYSSVTVGGGTDFQSFHADDSADVVLVITDCEFSFDFLEEHKRKKVIVLNIEGNTHNLRRCEVYRCR